MMIDDESDIMNVSMVGLEPLLALEHFQKNSEQYGLVISDLRMPVMNGYQFIKKVKKLKQVKIFCMSAFEIDYTQFRTESPFIDIDEFIQKPIESGQVFVLSSNHIEDDPILNRDCLVTIFP